MSAHPQPAPGAFILSLPRTGSTLLRLILDTHPEIYAPDELGLGHLAGGLSTTLGGLKELQGQSFPNVKRQGDPGEIAAEIRRIISELMSTHTHSKDKKMWCEKSPLNLDRMGILRNTFPDARFILLHRHCLDTAISCIDSAASVMGFALPIVDRYVARNPQNFVSATVEAWVEMSARMLQFEKNNAGVSMRLRYEDLVTDPAGQLEALCSFLGVSFEPDILERVFSAPHHQRTGRGDNKAIFSTGISDNRVGQGRRIPWHRVENLPDALLLSMNQTLERLGYPAVSDRDWQVGVNVRESPSTEKKEPEAVESKSAPPSINFKELFETRLAARLAGGMPKILTGSSYRFVISGAGGGTWLLDMTGEHGRVVPGGEHQGQGSPCTIEVSGGELMRILGGKQHPVQSQQEGKLRIEGRFDVQALQALLMLFKG